MLNEPVTAAAAAPAPYAHSAMLWGVRVRIAITFVARGASFVPLVSGLRVALAPVVLAWVLVAWTWRS